MRKLKVILENSKARESYPLAIGVDQIVKGRLSRWLEQAVEAARRSGACLTFSVSVHQDGADCDHEVG